MRWLPPTVLDCGDVLLGCSGGVSELLLCELCHQPGAPHHSARPSSILNLEHITHSHAIQAIACRESAEIETLRAFLDRPELPAVAHADPPNALVSDVTRPELQLGDLSEDRVDWLVGDVFFVVEGTNVG